MEGAHKQHGTLLHCFRLRIQTRLRGFETSTDNVICTVAVGGYGLEREQNHAPVCTAIIA